MPSMSYCMFENTSSEMNQCLNHMDSAINVDGESLNLNSYEKNAFHTLYEQCKEFVKMYDEFSGMLLAEEV